MTETLAAAFARAVAEKDDAAMRALLHPEIDFQGLTPRRTWEGASPEEVIDVLGTWFSESDVIESVEQVETDEFADRQRAGYRFRIRNDDGMHLLEQQAYLSEKDGRIGWLRIVCSGYRPVG